MSGVGTVGGLVRACHPEPTAAVTGVAAALADLVGAPDHVAVVGHGGVGTFWWCHLAGVPIERRWDQPGQGHYFTVELGAPVHHWRRIEDIDAPG